MAADLLDTIRSELDARLDQLRPVVAEYGQLLAAAAALKIDPSAAVRGHAPASSAQRVRRGRRGRSKRRYAPRGAAGQAILAALEDGPHTAAELAAVTAFAAPNVEANLRRLLNRASITRTEGSGRRVYALSAKPVG